VGDLMFRDCPIVIAPGDILEGTDGVVPLSLFAGFFLRLDAGAKTLDLLPYANAFKGGFLPARVDRGFLIVEARLNEAEQGHFLLDTGATYSAISHSMATALNLPRGLAAPVSLTSGAGESEGYVVSSGIRFRLGSEVL